MARQGTTTGTQDTATGAGQTQSGDAPSIVEQAQEATEQVQGTVARLSDSLREQMVSRLGEQKEKLAGGLETLSLALQTTSSEVRRQDNQQIAQYIDGAAGRLEALSTSLRENDVDMLTSKVEQVARQRPTLFLTVTLGVGLVASRLFKTSSRNQAERDQERARREEERQKRLREEEEMQRAADARHAEQRAERDAEAAAALDVTDLGGYPAVSTAAEYGVDDLSGVSVAPEYGATAGDLVDESALTSALLDPTGLGVGTTGASYDRDADAPGTSDPGGERS